MGQSPNTTYRSSTTLLSTILLLPVQRVPRVQFHLNGPIAPTFHHLVHADALVFRGSGSGSGGSSSYLICRGGGGGRW